MSFEVSPTISSKEIENIFRFILSGKAAPIDIADFLTALHTQGETPKQITAAAKIMRSHMVRASAPAGAIDVCGTGGDMKSTLNISTAVALVVAAGGVPVAKHGNRAQSSRSGSADLLESLGVKLDKNAIEEIGIGFMFAQNHHPAMKYVAPVRAQLGFRTIFNLLGPLCNPAGVRRQLLGVFDKKWLKPLAESLSQLDCDKAWIVCGNDGMDEITLTTTTCVVALNQGKINSFELNPETFGFSLVSEKELQGGTPDENKKAFEALLQGKADAYRDIVLLNSAAAFVVADRAKDIPQGLDIARDALDNRAADLLQKWIAYG
jgi:anthranilate phosphoribosyltransferase